MFVQLFRVDSISAALRADWPRPGESGEVIASFQHSCYVRMAQGRLLCIADLTLDDGPLTLRVDLGRQISLSSLGIVAGMLSSITDDGDLILADTILLRIDGTTVWNPPAVTQIARPDDIRCRIETVVAGLRDDAPNAGMAQLVANANLLADEVFSAQDNADHLTRIAASHVNGLVCGIRAGDMERVEGGVRGLVGLGPGLTPSGDDLLGGIMMGLISTVDSDNLEGVAITEYFAKSISRQAHKTNVISAALLAQACEGVASVPVHRLIAALLEPGDNADAVASARVVTGVGHTSGWDCLAGILVGVELGLRLNDQGLPNHCPSIIAVPSMNDKEPQSTI